MGGAILIHVHMHNELCKQSTLGPAVDMGGAPLLLAMNGRGYTVLHVHNESSASGQAPEEEEGPGSC